MAARSLARRPSWPAAPGGPPSALPRAAEKGLCRLGGPPPLAGDWGGEAAVAAPPRLPWLALKAACFLPVCSCGKLSRLGSP